MLELIKIKIHHSPRVNALGTIYDKRTKYCQTMLEDIRSFFKEQMLSTVISMSLSLKKAAARGMSVVQFDRESNGAIDYLALAHEILRVDGVSEFEKDMKISSIVKNIDDVKKDRVATTSEPEPVTLTTASPVEDRVDPVTTTAPVVKNEIETVAPKTLTEEAVVQNAAPASQSPIVDTDSEKEITFAINAPNAKDIFLVGDFNHWKINDSSRLSRTAEGRWEKRIQLAPGNKYKYKYVVDGEWTIDSDNKNLEQNSFGTFDSVIKL